MNEYNNWIYDTLNNVSRSFSFIIKELPIEIRDYIAIFYLVLRALDTIEDDMEINVDYKIEILKNFHLHLFESENQVLLNYGKGFENKLMLEFDNLRNAFTKIPEVYKNIIIEITQEMSYGMIKYINKDAKLNQKT